MLPNILLFLAMVSYAIASSALTEYRLINQLSTQHEAEAYCSSTFPQYDGHLATIDSQEENDLIASVCQDLGQRQGACSIGLDGATVEPDESTKWFDGTDATYTNWAADQPWVTEDHPQVAIIASTVTNGPGKWIMVQETGFPFICELPPLTVNGEEYIIGSRVADGDIYSGAGDTLYVDDILDTGHALVSQNRQYALVLDRRGLLAVYNIADDTRLYGVDGVALCDNDEPCHVILQSDANFVFYRNSDMWVVWASHDIPTWGSVSHLIMQNDGNLAAYANGGDQAFWDTFGSAAANGAFYNLDSMFGVEGSSGGGSGVYLMWIVGVLIVVNVICMSVYWWQRRGNKGYKV